MVGVKEGDVGGGDVGGGVRRGGNYRLLPWQRWTKDQEVRAHGVRLLIAA